MHSVFRVPFRPKIPPKVKNRRKKSKKCEKIAHSRDFFTFFWFFFFDFSLLRGFWTNWTFTPSCYGNIGQIGQCWTPLTLTCGVWARFGMDFSYFSNEIHHKNTGNINFSCLFDEFSEFGETAQNNSLEKRCAECMHVVGTFWWCWWRFLMEVGCYEWVLRGACGFLFEGCVVEW